MPSHIEHVSLNSIGHSIQRALHYAFYNWTREMPKSKRWFTISGLIIQGYTLNVILTRSLIWPFAWPAGMSLYVSAFIMYCIGYCIINAMLTMEFLRKTQLESDEAAARQIQRTLQPEMPEALLGYELETSYKPFRSVGGDYFDIIELPGNQVLFAMADVSGKGMAGALLASNIQAMVRSIAGAEADPLAMATQINMHLSRYTPGDRFATAVFIVLNRDTGELTYINAGHNYPILWSSGSAAYLEASGVPLGMFSAVRYEARTAVLAPGGALLLFTDGLTDSIPGDDPQSRLRDALAADPKISLSDLMALADPRPVEDDISILLVRRTVK